MNAHLVYCLACRLPIHPANVRGHMDRHDFEHAMAEHYAEKRARLLQALTGGR